MGKTELFFNSSSNVRIITPPTRNIICACNTHTIMLIAFPVKSFQTLGKYQSSALDFTVFQLFTQKNTVSVWILFHPGGQKLLLFSKLSSNIAVLIRVSLNYEDYLLTRFLFLECGWFVFG